MSIQIYNIKITDENGEIKTEKALLLEYFNKLAKECRKHTKGKTYDDLDEETERSLVFTNKLGFFEDKLNSTITELLIEVTYKPHKELLRELKDSRIIQTYPDTENPLDDCNGMIKELRKKVKAVIKVYEENELKEELIRGYGYRA